MRMMAPMSLRRRIVRNLQSATPRRGARLGRLRLFLDLQILPTPHATLTRPLRLLQLRLHPVIVVHLLLRRYWRRGRSGRRGRHRRGRRAGTGFNASRCAGRARGRASGAGLLVHLAGDGGGSLLRGGPQTAGGAGEPRPARLRLLLHLVLKVRVVQLGLNGIHAALDGLRNLGVLEGLLHAAGEGRQHLRQTTPNPNLLILLVLGLGLVSIATGRNWRRADGLLGQAARAKLLVQALLRLGTETDLTLNGVLLLHLSARDNKKRGLLILIVGIHGTLGKRSWGLSSFDFRRDATHDVGQSYAHFTIQGGGRRIVLPLDGSLFGHAVACQKVVHLLVATHLHRLDFLFRPRIHLHRADETDVDLRGHLGLGETYAQSTMLSGAFEADKRSVRNRCPLWACSAAVSADLWVRKRRWSYVIPWQLTQLCQDRRWHTVHGEGVKQRVNVFLCVGSFITRTGLQKKQRIDSK